MQTDTKELSKWKGRVEKSSAAANTRLQGTRIPSEMEVPPHYKLRVHCLHFFFTISTANTSLQGTKINPFCVWRHVDKGPNLAKNRKKHVNFDLLVPAKFLWPPTMGIVVLDF